MRTTATRTSTTLTRLICAHGMPSPASCVDCMDEGVFLPAQARRANTTHGQTGVAGTIALKSDCGVQSIANAVGADYMEAANALLAAGWVPGTGTSPAQLTAAVQALGFTATRTGHTLDSAARDGGTFIVIGYRGRRGHAWTIDGGRHVNALRWDQPARTTMRYTVLQIAA